jgi:hypothetical protein
VAVAACQFDGLPVVFQVCGMTTYTIIPRPDRDGFDVEVICGNGQSQTKTGFKTQAAAETWVLSDARHSDPSYQGNFRLLWRS